MKTTPAITLLIAGAVLAGRLLCVLDGSPPAPAPDAEWLFDQATVWIIEFGQTLLKLVLDLGACRV